MGSRYSHWCCTFSHSSIVSWIRIKRSSQAWFKSTKLAHYSLPMMKKIYNFQAFFFLWIKLNIHFNSQVTDYSFLEMPIPQPQSHLNFCLKRLDERRPSHSLGFHYLIIQHGLNLIHGGQDGHTGVPVWMIMKWHRIPNLHHILHGPLQSEFLKVNSFQKDVRCFAFLITYNCIRVLI